MAKAKKHRLALAVERCKGCKLCVEFCPQDVLVLTEDKINSKGYPYAEALLPVNCTGCLCCVMVCPDAVIEIFEIEDEDKK